MPEKSYGFAIGNLRARENTLLKKSDMAQLASLRDTRQLAETLADKGFADRSADADVPQILKADSERMWNYLTEISPDDELFRPFLLENDFHNLKVVLKGIIRSADYSGMLLPGETVTVPVLENAVHEKRFDALPENMRSAAARGYEILISSGDSQLSDGVIDAACMAAQLETVSQKNCKSALVREIITSTVFFQNIKAALRAAKAAKSSAFLDDTLIETGILTKAALKNAALAGTDKVLELLGKAGSFGAHAAEAFSKSPSDFEKYCDDYVISIARRAKYVTLGAEPVIGYMMARRAEMKNIRIIYSGIKTGQPQEKTLGRLRELYD